MKKLLSLILCAGLVFSLLVSASAADSDTMQKTVRALGIMTGDANGNMNLSRAVTRAEFSKMLCAASVYKDTIGSDSGVSPFKDVKYTHWASEYVKTAVTNGWMTGYVDGTFQPDSAITLEQAASAILKLLGYTAADYSGTYPAAQISKFKSLKLDAGISVSQGKILTRNDCMYIFYNLMGAKNKEGKTHASVLGYTLNSSGEIDYDGILNADMAGPFVVDDIRSWKQTIPFSADNAIIYRNGKVSSASAVSAYDVYYYHTDSGTVWTYSNHAIGVVTDISPSTVSPESVTVGGNKYTLGTTAIGKFSSTGSFSVGDSVALLLGMNGEAVDVLQASEIDGIYYGVVVSSQNETYAPGKTGYFVSVACTDGIVRSFLSTNTQYYIGNTVTAGYTGGEAWIKGLSVRSLSGTVNSAGDRIGDYYLAENAEILEYTSDGNYKTVYPSRLAGYTLKSDDVRFYALDEEKKISALLLINATGDLNKYGILTNVTASESGMDFSGTYNYIIDGTAGSVKTANYTYNVTSGAAMFTYKSGSISGIKNMTSAYINDITRTYVMSGDKKYLLADEVQVYINTGTGYTLSDIGAILDTESYSLTGYYETGFSAGGRIRVIIAS